MKTSMSMNRIGADAQQRLRYRLWWMLWGWGAIGCAYLFSMYFQQSPYVMTPGFVDTLILYSPHALWPYLSFFILIPYAYMVCDITRVLWLAHAMQISALISGIIYTLCPTTLPYPIWELEGLTGQGMAALLAVDQASNCLPSLHVTLSLLALAALGNSKHRTRTLLYALWALAIILSTLFLKRHLFIDATTGLVLAIFAGYASMRILSARQKHSPMLGAKN